MLRLTGCRIIDGAGSEPFEGFDVFVDDERIVSIQPTAQSSELMTAAETIDLTGATLMPGFVDCHVQLRCQPNPQRLMTATPTISKRCMRQQ